VYEVKAAIAEENQTPPPLHTILALSRNPIARCRSSRLRIRATIVPLAPSSTQFERHTVGNIVLQAILVYSASYPFDPLTDHGASKKRFLNQFVLEHYAILNDIEKSITARHLQLRYDKQFFENSVPCKGHSLCAELMLYSLQNLGNDVHI